MVLVMPVGPYFKTGFKPVSLLIEENVDRRALGVGDVKVGGNYAAGLRQPGRQVQGLCRCPFPGRQEEVHRRVPGQLLRDHQNDQYVTPHSESILPSITNKSLITLAEDMGLRRSAPDSGRRNFRIQRGRLLRYGGRDYAGGLDHVSRSQGGLLQRRPARQNLHGALQRANRDPARRCPGSLSLAIPGAADQVTR